VTDTLVRSTDPSRPDSVVVEVPAAGADDVAKAAEAARAAQREWQATPPAARSTALSAAAEAVAAASQELTDLMVREVGKPLGEAAGEAARAVAILRYYAQQVLDPDGQTYPAAGSTLLMARHRPRGVAGLITPWNFPFAIPLWKAAPALAYGNAVLLKPAPEATACALRLAELLHESLPADLVAVVPGEGEAGQAVVAEADVVSFTGSVVAGGAVRKAAADRGIPGQCEMGGQNASIVLPDVDVEATAAVVAGAAMGYAGQKCTATSRVVVVDDGQGFPDRFRDALVAAVEGLGMGEPAEDGVAVGPVITAESRDAVVAAAREARDSGGRVLTGGSAPDRDGWFVAPTLVDGVEPDARVAQEEVFGPFAALLTVPDPDRSVEVANGVRHGLVSAVFTRDIGVALDVADRLDTGMVRVNAATSGVDFYAPFGGEKESSYGPREQGKAARDFYTSVRTVTIAGGAA
jgi:acyl-CoA reductase-like NAD-dependent aldehyde dehydrogenase